MVTQCIGGYTSVRNKVSRRLILPAFSLKENPALLSMTILLVIDMVVGFSPKWSQDLTLALMGGQQKTEKFVIIVLGILLLFDNYGQGNGKAKKEALGPHCLDLSPGSVPDSCKNLGILPSSNFPIWNM